MNQESSSGQQQKRLQAVITEYKRRRNAGQTVDPQAVIKAYPDLADALKQFFQQDASSINPALASTKLGKLPDGAASGRETINPAKASADTASEFTARMFGRYQLLRPLGEGAMGRVFLALDTHLDRQVALKMPRTAAADKSKDTAEFLARFTREAKAAAGLKHPNICSVYDAGEIDGTAYITMDFINGVPLSELVGSDRLTAVPEIIRLVRTIADAVMHAHSKGIIHRDLKPGNILVDDQMNPFVTDFGLARRDASSDGSRITQEGLLIGTPAYMAPEQVRGEQTKVGAGSDIYSLGVIFFELLTGRLPFEGSVAEMLAKVLRDPPPIPSRLRPELTEDVDDVVWKMLLKEPDRRYPSMQDVITALDKLTDKLQQATSRETTTSARATTAAAQSPFEIQKSHIELMLKKGQYAGAIRDLEALAEEKSPAAKSVVEWARKTLPNAKKEAKALSPSGLAAMLKTAEQMFEKCDYQGCIQLLDDVPALKRSEAMETLLQKAQQREAAAEELMEQIRDKERRENPEGLDALVKKYLKLKPGNAYAKKLMQALQTYSKTPAGRRKYRFERGRLQPMPEISFFRQYALLAVLVGVLVFLASYSYVMSYLKGGSQVLTVYVDGEWLKQRGELTLLVDDDEHKISSSAADGEPLTITVPVGDREFSVKHGDAVLLEPRTLRIERNGKSVLQVTQVDIELRNSPLMASVPNGGDTSGQLDDASTAGNISMNSAVPLTDLEKVATGTWQPLVTEDTTLPEPDKMTWKDGVLSMNKCVLPFPEIKARNMIVRGEIRKMEGESGSIHLRTMKSPNPNADGGSWRIYNVWYHATDANGAGEFAVGKTSSPWTTLTTAPSDTAFAVGDFIPIAFAVIDDRLLVFLEGRKIIDVQDSTFDAGSISLSSWRDTADFRNMEYQILDQLPESDLDKVATGTWKPLTVDKKNARLPEMMSWKDGILRIETQNYLTFPETTGSNIVVRAEVRKKNSGGGAFSVRKKEDSSVKLADSGMAQYKVSFEDSAQSSKNTITLERSGSPWVKLAEQRSVTQLDADTFIPMAVVAKDDRIMVFINGKKEIDVTDGTYRDGYFALDAWFGPAEFRNMEYQLLDESIASDLDKVATGQWKPLVTQETVLSDPEKMTWKNGVLSLNNCHLDFLEIKARNMVVRGEIRKMEGGTGAIRLRANQSAYAKAGGEGWKHYDAWYEATNASGSGQFGIGENGSPQKTLTVVPSEKSYAIGDFVPIAFAAIDDRLLVFSEGRKIIDLEDTTSSSGFFALISWRGSVEFRNMEYQILDDPSVSDLDKVLTGAWKPLNVDSKNSPLPDKMTWKDGVLGLEQGNFIVFPETNGSNIAVRAEVKKKFIHGGHINVRRKQDASVGGGTAMYIAWLDHTSKNSCGLHKSGSPWVALGDHKSATKFEEGAFIPMAVVAKDDRIMLFINGRKELEVNDGSFRDGLVAFDGTHGAAEFRNMEYQFLDAEVPPKPPVQPR